MTIDLWEIPVEVSFDCGDHFISIGSSREALVCLMTRWPDQRGEAFAVARKTCLRAINGKADALTAAKAFEEAALKAGLLRG